LEGIILGTAVSTHQGGWVAGSVVAMVATIALYSSGGPKTSFRPPFSEENLKKLQLYCRYPQGLTPEQWHTVLEACGQPDFYDHGLSAPVVRPEL